MTPRSGSSGMTSVVRGAVVAGLLAGLAGVFGTGCEEFEPFEPERSEAPFRFFGAAADGPAVFLTEVAVTDTTVRLDLRARDVERLTAVAFELAVADSVAVIDTASAGDFFQPGTPIVFDLVQSPTSGLRWVGVVGLREFTTDVSGGGLLASLVVRRITDAPFDVRLVFDTAATRLYGPGGQPTSGQAVGGRLVHDPDDVSAR